jgi:hypothetical protein
MTTTTTDTLPPDTDAVLDVAHFCVADAARDQHEALLRAGLLDLLRDAGLDDRVRRVLVSHPAETSRLVRVLDAAVFTPNPKADASSRLQAMLAALDASGALAGSVTTHRAGEASGEARRAAVAARDARILKLAAAVGQTVSEARRWQLVRRKLGKNAPSVATIRRVVKHGQK